MVGYLEATDYLRLARYITVIGNKIPMRQSPTKPLSCGLGIRASAAERGCRMGCGSRWTRLPSYLAARATKLGFRFGSRQLFDYRPACGDCLLQLLRLLTREELSSDFLGDEKPCVKFFCVPCRLWIGVVLVI